MKSGPIGIFSDPDAQIGAGYLGTVSDFLIVHSAVPWTQPDDLEVDLTKPMAGLGDAEPNGFTVLFVDGHVMVLPKTIKPEVLSALSTRAGGKAINPDDLKP